MPLLFLDTHTHTGTRTLAHTLALTLALILALTLAHAHWHSHTGTLYATLLHSIGNEVEIPTAASEVASHNSAARKGWASYMQRWTGY